MAVVIGPLHSSEARGAVGSLVYNSHRGRAYVKSNTHPTTQYSDKQIAMRAHMVPVIALWQSISNAQRSCWEQFANEHLFPHWTGSDLRLSGWNWFAKANFLLEMLGQSLQSNPPSLVTSIPLFPFLSDAGEGYIDVGWTTPETPPVPDWLMLFYIAGPHSSARHPSIKMASFVGSTAFMDGIYDITPLAPGWYTVFMKPLSLQGIQLTPAFVRGQVT